MDDPRIAELERRLAQAEASLRKRAAAEAGLLDAAEQHCTIFDSIDEGFCLIEVLFDNDGQAVDYRLLSVNQAFERQTGLRDVVGRRMRDLAPAHEQYWFDIYGEIALTGEARRFERRAEALGRWYDVHAFRLGGAEKRHVGVLFKDIVERKRAERGLLDANELLRATLDGSLEIIQLFKAIRDERGAIVDFEWLLTNKQWDDRWGPRSGQSLLKENPAVVESGVWDRFLKVMETGAPITHEHYYAHEQFDGWFLQTIAKANDGILLSTLDVTDRKRADIALRESEERLGLAIEIGGMASWDWDLRTGAVAWNDGHFLMQGYAVGEVTPSFAAWIARVHPDDRDETVSLIEQARDEQRIYAHAFRSLHADGSIVWCLARGRFFYDEEGKPYRMIGVMEDVTEQKRAESALRQSKERQTFLLDLSDTLRPLVDAVEVAATGLKLLRRELKLGRTFVAEIRGRDPPMTVLAEDGDDDLAPMPAEFDPADFPEGSWTATESMLVVDDLAARTDLTGRQTQALQSIGLNAFIVAPLHRAADGVMWALVVGDPIRRSWAAEAQVLVAEAAERLWGAMERARGEAALRESQARLAAVFDSAPIGIALMSADGRMMISNAEAQRFLPSGRMPSQDPERGWRWRALDSTGKPIPEDDFPGALARRGLRTVPGMELIYVDDAGEERWTSVSAVPLFDDGGSVSGVIITMLDIDAVKRAEEALRQSEERFRQFANASAAGLWIRDAATLKMEFVSPAIAGIYGVQPGGLLGQFEHWAALIVPDDRAMAIQHIERARRGESVVHEFRIQRPSDGAFRWIRNSDFPLDANGHVHRIGGIAEDVTEAKLLAEHQGVLLAELQHRVRNIMAMIRSITARTANRAESVAEYESLLTGRLLALARVQALLTRAADSHVGVRSIVHDEVSAQAPHADQYTLDGPDVKVPAKAAEALTLAIHELATNALKYGAFAREQGMVEVRWTTVGRGDETWLSFDWTESGAPPAALREPRRTGFGSELIEGRIPYELGGRSRLTISAGGAKCHLEFPLTRGGSLLETGAPMAATVFGGALDMTGEPNLAGRRVLVVEDEYFLAIDTARALKGAGAEVLGPCPTETAASTVLEAERPDAVVLDINLGAGASLKLAETLKDAGIPFVFVTGYDQAVVPPEFDQIERLPKPAQLRQIVGAVSRLVGAG